MKSNPVSKSNMLTSLSQSTMNESEMEIYLDKTVSMNQNFSSRKSSHTSESYSNKLSNNKANSNYFRGNISDLFQNESHSTLDTSKITNNEKKKSNLKNKPSKKIFNSIIKVGKKIFEKVSKIKKNNKEV